MSVLLQWVVIFMMLYYIYRIVKFIIVKFFHGLAYVFGMTENQRYFENRDREIVAEWSEFEPWAIESRLECLAQDNYSQAHIDRLRKEIYRRKEFIQHLD